MPQGLLGTSAATRPSPIVKLWLNSSGYYFFPPHCFCGCWDKSGKRTLLFCFSIAYLQHLKICQYNAVGDPI